MTSDYSKKKNAELEELLKARGLSHTGRKADLIERLLNHDKSSTPTPNPIPAATAPSTSAKSSATAVAEDEDQIDWDDDDPTGATKATPAGAAALAAGGQGQIPTPAAVPNQVTETDPATTSDLTVNPPAVSSSTPAATTTGAAETTTTEPAPTSAPTTTFAQSLPPSSLETELAKRAARAARFGIPLSDPTSDKDKEKDKDKAKATDALKAAERAKKFGTTTSATAPTISEAKSEDAAVKGLNSALPERAAKKRGREGVDGADEVEKGSKRQDSRKREGRPTGRARGAAAVPNETKSEGTNANARTRSRGKDPAGKAKTTTTATTTTTTTNGDASAKKSALGEKDRLAAEARKKRFAATAAATSS